MRCLSALDPQKCDVATPRKVQHWALVSSIPRPPVTIRLLGSEFASRCPRSLACPISWARERPAPEPLPPQNLPASGSSRGRPPHPAQRWQSGAGGESGRRSPSVRSSQAASVRHPGAPRRGAGAASPGRRPSDWPARPHRASNAWSGANPGGTGPTRVLSQSSSRASRQTG